MMTTGGWDGQDHAMSAAAEDEFNQFLDMTSMGHMGDDMQFDFNGFQEPQTQGMMHRPRDPPDTVMTDGNASTAPMMPQGGNMVRHQAPAMPTAVRGHQGPTVSNPMIPSSAPTADSISNIDAQIQYLQQQKFQQQQRQLQERAVFFSSQNCNVPPTPQSLEMPPNSGHFYQHDQLPQDIYDRNYQQRDQHDMSFTPLVSPAVTPLEPHFHMENAFTVPGAYFSPLTSPALHAQNDSNSVYDQSTHSNNSPVEVELDTATGPALPPAVDLSKKARKNNAAKTRKQGVKSSPISKPQRRKAGPSPAIVSKVLTEVEERSNGVPEVTNLPVPATASTDVSDEYASVSPENLTDMPPPPVPARRSTSKSPYIAAQTGGAMSATPTPPAGPVAGPVSSLAAQMGDEPSQPHPATPASLMKLPASKSKRPASSSQETATEHIESLVLPESVSTKPFTPIDTAAAAAAGAPAQSEPQSAKTASFQTPASPMGGKRPGTASAGQSPQILPGSSGPAARKTPQLASRASRKRSTGSIHVSPALLPRISPNIKPLLPGTPGMSSDDAASRLLTSKSNYQNILEGNTVPGLHYPTDLSANLTSKRTSHKIAEQGRRNRINSALQEMASLLPDQHKLGSGDDSDKKDSKQSNAANSKASVVEKAITHLKHLELENVGLKKELEELKARLKSKEPS